MQNEVAERVMTVVAKSQRIPREKVMLASSFDELGIDSLGGISIMFDLETEFGISLSEESAGQLRTIQDLVNGVEALLRTPEAVAAVEG
ncbi:MAG TPA: acyl carrier protein [Longimicrobiaceae bacterium]|nr:acyl carrier protein [Longimicrobiaceae bacterium]